MYERELNLEWNIHSYLEWFLAEYVFAVSYYSLSRSPQKLFLKIVESIRLFGAKFLLFASSAILRCNPDGFRL